MKFNAEPKNAILYLPFFKACSRLSFSKKKKWKIYSFLSVMRFRSTMWSRTQICRQILCSRLFNDLFKVFLWESDLRNGFWNFECPDYWLGGIQVPLNLIPSDLKTLSDSFWDPWVMLFKLWDILIQVWKFSTRKNLEAVCKDSKRFWNSFRCTSANFFWDARIQK